MVDLKWNKVSGGTSLPPTRTRLVVQMECGKEVEAVRPEHIKCYEENDKGFRDLRGNRLLGVNAWRYP
jgi:hypothetical protein